MLNNPVFVTKPSLPPLEDLIPYLERIWETKVLTNGGPFHEQLEKALCEYLGVPYISLFSNATIGLITALKALNITGEVITTPYTFVATTQALLWNNIKPVFVDIDPVTLNLDPKKIEASITPSTTAILPVHVYGHPCNVDALEVIAKRHNIKVIYDAAHAFGVQCHCGGSVLNHGDLSVLSFHATKVFNTLEGGAIISSSAETKLYVDQLRNFGYENDLSVTALGINGKLNELSAAIGLLQLQHIDEQIKKRKAVDKAYRKGLRDIPNIRCHVTPEPQKSNYNYFPIFVEEGYPLTRDQLMEKLRENRIHTKRYFYPLVSDFLIYKRNSFLTECLLPNAKRVASEVLCLPIYPTLSGREINHIIDVIAFHA